jgi:membrane protein DedA with SNARE-associated domain
MRQGRWALLVAKFVPGLSTIAPPLAGVVGLARAPFVSLDILGSP